MLFSSLTFLYYFLPIVLLLYFLVPKNARNALLVVASLFFYGWGEPKYLVIMLVSILCGYILGQVLGRLQSNTGRKLCLAAALLVHLGLLGWFKYADFFLESFGQLTGLPVPILSIALPLGISFYTFQIMGYLIDIYRKEITPQRSLIRFAAYVSLFPQLIAGPIVRYQDMEHALAERTYSMEQVYSGLRRFLIGLSKKVLLANTLGELCHLYQSATEPSLLFAWLSLAAYTMQIYFDFSGYSDMAIGLGRVLGFPLPENFNYPYLSKSITEFWRRWHMTLGSWFRDYVYIPLGGNRVSTPRFLLNLVLVWGLTGLWHGAAWNFVLWGLLYAVLLVAEKLGFGRILARMGPFSHLYVLFFVMLGWVLFQADSLASVGSMLTDLFGLGGLPLVSTESLYYLQSYGVILVVGIIGCTPLLRAIYRTTLQWDKQGYVRRAAEPLLLALLLLLTTAFLVDGSFNPFLYFRF